VAGEAACPAGFTGDGDLNILDLVASPGGVRVVGPRGGLQRGRVLNALDFICFQGEFAAVCP